MRFKMILFLILLLSSFILGCTGEFESAQTPNPSPSPSPIPQPTQILTPATISTPEKFSFYFFINSTGEELNGEVYLNGKFLGETEDGEIILPLDSLSPGTVVLKGYYKGEPFEFEFELTEEDIEQYSGMEYYVTKEDIDYLLFGISKLDWKKIETKIFEFINLHRGEEGVKPLRWNEKVWAVAYNHSKDMCERGYFAHKNPEGGEHYDRLKKAGIYYIVAAEALHSYPVLGPINETQIAKEIVDGWLKSPGHRSIVVDVDELYSDGGVGVFCCEDICYATLNVVGLEEGSQTTLDRDYAIYYYLNDPGWGHNIPLTVSAEVKTSHPVDIYIMPNKNEYEKFLKNKGFKQIKYVKNVKGFKETLKAEVGWILVIHSNYYNNVDVKTKIRILT